MMRCPALFLCAALATSSIAEGTQPVQTLQTGTRVVVVDVTVTDKNGHTVPHLPQSAFTVTEDNHPQQITRFIEHSEQQTNAIPPQPPTEPGVFTNAVPQNNGPLNVLVLDTLNTPMQDQMYVHSQLEKFVQSMKPGAQIAIATITTQLNLIQSFTSDPETLMQAVKSAESMRVSPLMNNGIGNGGMGSGMRGMGFGMGGMGMGGMGMGMGEANYTRFRMRQQYTNDAFQDLAHFLSYFPGRKNVIWFSNAFPMSNLYGLDGDFSTVFDMTPEFDRTTYLFSMSQVAFYAIEARGLGTNPSFNASSPMAGSGPAFANRVMWQNMRMGDEEMFMKQMASDMGGQAFVATNDIAGATASALENGSNYYTLDYRPTDHAMDGKYHHIRVTLNDPAYHLTYRKGYNASFQQDPVDKKKEKKGEPVQTVPPTPEQLYMQRGAPQLEQILFRARITPLGTQPGGSVTHTLAEGASADPKLKKSYRNFALTISADTARIATTPDASGKRKMSVEFTALVYDMNGALRTANTRVLTANLTPTEVTALQTTGLQLHMPISIPAKGEYFIRLGVRDTTSNRMGTLEVAANQLKKLPASTQM